MYQAGFTAIIFKTVYKSFPRFFVNELISPLQIGVVSMRKRHIPLIISFLATVSVSAQQKINGIVEDNETGEPVSYASVTPGRGDMIVTDSHGKFSLVVRRQPKTGDSIFISAIGYFPKKISIKDLLAGGKIKLKQEQKVLDQVKVYASLKGESHEFRYYRSFKFDTIWVEKIDSVKYRTNDRYRWNRKFKKDIRYNRMNKGNGEIGYVFEMPVKKFNIGSVQVKINHNYDTCWLKLHLRNVGAAGLGLPEDDIIKKDVVIPVTLKYGLVEFDLNWAPISLRNNQIYVGFELQRCGCSESSAPSFFFVGNEQGLNYFKENQQAQWQKGAEYTIYVRMITN